MEKDIGFGVFAAMPVMPAPADGVIPLTACVAGGFEIAGGAVAIPRAGDYLAQLTVRAPGEGGAEAAFALWLNDAPLVRARGSGCRSSLAVFGVRERARLSLRAEGLSAPGRTDLRPLVTLALLRLEAGPA